MSKKHNPGVKNTGFYLTGFYERPALFSAGPSRGTMRQV
jgi:hypothetical protein